MGSIARPFAAAALAVLLAAEAAFAAPVQVAPAAPQLVRQAQADCYAIGQQVAAQNGGQLARASQANRGGQTVCVIVVLVPGQNGQRPRRVEVVVPAG